jgi:predicted RNase H-like nuclease (RuvC/YqgF family)
VAKKKLITIAGLKRANVAMLQQLQHQQNESRNYIAQLRSEFKLASDHAVARHNAALQAKDEEIANLKRDTSRYASRTWELEAQLKDARAFFERIVTLMAGGKIEQKKDADAS